MKQNLQTTPMLTADDTVLTRRGVQRAWSRVVFPLMLLLVGLSIGCSDSDSGPTGPGNPSGPVALFGVWQGSMTAQRSDTGEQMTCSLTMEPVDTGGPGPELGIGNWEAFCSDGTNGGDIASATRVLSEVVLVIAFPGEPFAGCGWGSTAELTSGRLTGDWQVTEGCAEPWSGTFDLSL